MYLVVCLINKSRFKPFRFFVQVLTSNLTCGDKVCVVIGKVDGYCIDTSIDDKIYHVADNLYISSQGGACNLEHLRLQKITHIVNVATGIVNQFPNVSIT